MDAIIVVLGTAMAAAVVFWLIYHDDGRGSRQ